MQPVMITSKSRRFVPHGLTYEPTTPTRHVYVGSGSQLAMSATPSCPASVQVTIDTLMSHGIIAEIEGRLTFVHGHLFDNPNAAGEVLSRSTVNPRELFVVSETGISLKSYDHIHGLKTRAGK